MVHRRDLIALGLTGGAIDDRVRRGVLFVQHRAVYCVGHPALTPRGRLRAAVLACGEEAVLSHQAAAGLWDLVSGARRQVDVTTAASRHPRPGIAVHRVRRLGSLERSEVAGLPVTSVARTLLDLAAQLPEPRLDRLLERAERLRVLDAREIRELCDRRAGHHGAGALRRAMARYDSAGEHARSPLEARFVRLCRAAGLPVPVLNAPVAGFEVDAFWPGHRLVVELDGFAVHGTRAAFERDRARDAALQAAGLRVVRFTHRQVSRDPAGAIATVAALLGSPQATTSASISSRSASVANR